jgi:hypothetical protein
MCFHILTEPTIPEEKELPTEGEIFKDITKDLQSDMSTPPRNSVRSDGPRVPSVDTTQAKLLFWGGLFVAATITEISLALLFFNSEVSGKIVDLFGLAFGFLAATATALLVGRLDSKLLGVSKYVIAILFLYSAIQPVFDFLLTNNADLFHVVRQASLVVIALLCKVLLFVVIHWLAMTNRLLYYMVEAYTLHVKVEAHRRQFLAKLQS